MEHSPAPWTLQVHTNAPGVIDATDDWTVQAADGSSVCFEGAKNECAQGNAYLLTAAPIMKAALEEIASINPADLQRKPEMALTHAFLLARKKAIDTLALLSPPSTKE